jgi:hypothetical protein
MGGGDSKGSGGGLGRTSGAARIGRGDSKGNGGGSESRADGAEDFDEAAPAAIRCTVDGAGGG